MANTESIAMKLLLREILLREILLREILLIASLVIACPSCAARAVPNLRRDRDKIGRDQNALTTLSLTVRRRFSPGRGSGQNPVSVPRNRRIPGRYSDPSPLHWLYPNCPRKSSRSAAWRGPCHRATMSASD